MKWTETVLTTPFAQLAIPQNIRFDESGENIIWDKVENADYYYVSTGSISGTSCEQPILENWKQYLSPWDYYGDHTDDKYYISLYAVSYSDLQSSSYSDSLEISYTPIRDESIIVPQIRIEDNHITWDAPEQAEKCLGRIAKNGKVYNTYEYGKDSPAMFDIEGYPEGDYQFELCVIDEEGNYNTKIYPLPLNPLHDESIWIPRLYHKFDTILWDYDTLRHPDTHHFWLRIRKQKDNSIVKLEQEWGSSYYGLKTSKGGAWGNIKGK